MGRRTAAVKRQEQRQRQEARRSKVAFQRGRKREYGDSEWDEDLRKFQLQLRPHGLFIRDVCGDGNCCFRAIADQLGLGSSAHPEVRQRVVEFIESHREDFEPFIEDDVPFDGYVARMRKDRAWGGQLELQASSLLYHVNVFVHQLGSPRWDIVNFAEPGVRAIQISYHDGDHYNSVRPIADATPHEASKIPPLVEGSTASPPPPPPPAPQVVKPTKKEKIVMESTGEKDLEKVRATLMRNGDDVDAAISEIVVTAQDEDQEDEDALEAVRAVEKAEKEEREKKEREERERREEEEKEKKEKEEKLREKMSRFDPQPTNRDRKQAKGRATDKRGKKMERKKASAKRKAAAAAAASSSTTPASLPEQMTSLRL